LSIQKTPEKNSIFFSWLNNYAGILLKTPTKTLLFDPVDVKAKTFPHIDAILITHEHYDHLDPPLIADIQKATACTVIADATSTKKLKLTIPNDKLQEVKPGMETQVGEVTIKVEKSNHPPAQSPVTYIVTTEDNLKVYHTADSLPFPELGLIAQRESFDLVFCTVGIAPGASPHTGFEIARLTKPQIAVPYHTGTLASQKEFEALLKEELNRTACLIPQQNKVYQVTKRQEK
jgi:L-ascorbate metabolism protein UlaG (beta-lactamase superfamily)